MGYRILLAAGGLLVLGYTTTAATAVNESLPIRNGRPVVAVVNDDAISLDEFVAEVGAAADRARLRQGRGTAGELQMLNRLITVKLVAQEAAAMGIVELPEIQKQVEVTSREILREVLLDRLVKDIQPDAAAVEKQYRDLVRQWKTTSLLFQDEAAAKRAQKEIAGGAPFADVAARAVASKSARTEGDNGYHGRKDYLPQIAEILAGLRAGQVSPVIHLQAGFAVVQVADIRYPDDPEARAEARKAAVADRQQAFLKAHGEALRKQYAVVDKALLASVNYEAQKPGLDALLKDQRVIARIKGAESVTVGDLTDYLRMQFFHGSDNTRQLREMNEKKEAAFDATLGRRLLNLEAGRLGIDKTNAYRDRVKGYRESLVFNSFIEKVIAPDNKMREDEVRQYYDAHLRDYSYPEMLKIRSLAFARRDAAEKAIAKLREGTDYTWVAANADGQVASNTKGLLTFAGQPVMTDSLPGALQKAVAGTRAGDLRLYASPEGPFYVVSIEQVIAPVAKPYAEVRDEIAKKLYGEKLKKGLESYAAKLRAQSRVETYLKKG
jgi:hypothetical protein